ncbi:MAG: SPOR domain-containing protein [Gammaproteobacteria bacterium]
MQQSTKQRIVGTIVLLALALIFLPIIFDGQGSYETPISSRIPDPPEIAILPEPVQTRPVIVADSLPEPDNEEDEESGATEEVGESAAVAATDEDGTDTDTHAADTETELAAVITSEPVYQRDPPGLGADGLPQGWSVRLGSFADAANAQNLTQRLLDAGYRAYTRTIQSEQGDLTGVYVGPWVDRSTVAQYQQELQQQFQLAGIVVRYEIEAL